MYIIKNAFKSISRGKGRNILIGIIVLVIAFSACIALSINQASKTARESTMGSMEITAQISYDRSKMMENMNSGSGTEQGTPDRTQMREMFSQADSLSVEEMETYAKAQSVKSFYYTLTTSLNGTEELEPVSTSEDTEETTSAASSAEGSQAPNSEQRNGQGGDMPQMNEGGMGGPMGGMGTQGDFTFTGYSGDDAMADFINGTSTITSGEIMQEGTKDLTCIISDELAAYNGLAVGDELLVSNPNNEDETYTFTVCGIYNNSQSGTTQDGFMGGFSTSTEPANQIYTTYAALKTVTEASGESAETETDANTGMEKTTALREQESGTYTFTDVEAYEAFEEQARELGLEDSYTITSSDVSAFEQSLIPLENLTTFAMYFLLVILVIGAIVMVIVNVFNIRGRKYEIGVLTAIGMKKQKVAVQFITEIFTVTFVAIIIGTMAGAVASVPISNTLLENQIQSQEQSQTQQQQNFGRPQENMQAGNQMGSQAAGGMGLGNMFGGSADAAEYVSTIDSATNLTVVLQLMGIGLIFTLFGSLAAVLFVMRYEPLKILSTRD